MRVAGSATDPADFRLTGGPLRLLAGQRVATLTLTPDDDALACADLALAGCPPGGGRLDLPGHGWAWALPLRSLEEFMPEGQRLPIVAGCDPDDTTQALFVTRGGAGQLPELHVGEAQVLVALREAPGVAVGERDLHRLEDDGMAELGRLEQAMIPTGCERALVQDR